MKLLLLFCAFLLVCFAAQAEDATSRLVQPSKSSLKLVQLKSSQELLAEFSGRLWIEGTLFGVWAEGSDRLAETTPEYTLVPNAGSRAKLPHFVINDPPHLNSYKVKSIEIKNGEEALRFAIGRNAIQRFIEKKTGFVRATGRFQLEEFSVGVECDAAWAKAKVLRMQLPEKATQHQKALEGC
nr:hypothetical protein [uncultured Rhodoferax sp.]